MTAGVAAALTAEQVQTVFAEYLDWCHNVRDTLPSEDQMFTTEVNNQTVWVIDDGTATTILFPHEY